jgi:Terminase small subunit
MSFALNLHHQHNGGVTVGVGRATNKHALWNAGSGDRSQIVAKWNQRLQQVVLRTPRRRISLQRALLCGSCNANELAMGQRLRNSKHEKFAREVAALTPLATAYREAGFLGDLRWHRYNASKLANKPNVKARIEELRVEFEAMSAIHVEYVRHQLLRTIEADPRDLFERDSGDPTGKRFRLRSIADLPRHLTAAIAKLKIDPETGAPVEVSLADKNAAAATLLRSLPGGAVERHELSLEEIVLASMRAPAPALPRNSSSVDGSQVRALRRISV